MSIEEIIFLKYMILVKLLSTGNVNITGLYNYYFTCCNDMSEIILK